MKTIVRYTLIALLFFPAAANSQVRVWEQALEIPTYLVDKPDPNPRFYNGRAYQGAAGHVYPYPIYDRLTDIKENKTYKAVYLENDYVRICVLPEIGGRIFEAVDKTNGYDFFYRQHVIKPALIGMLGAWISGGVEWNFPHHHRTTSFLPVDYTITENRDGGKTLWVGEIEYRHRMKWLLGFTLYPEKSLLEVTVKLFNRTPIVQSFLYWANVAVHANNNYRVIFPPSTQLTTYHGKNRFDRWPVPEKIYGADNTQGTDVSWWKNHPQANSLFAWNCEEDFLAGYDYGKKAGVVHVADHHIMPGKKFWTWGTGGRGQRWETILSDNDGPYLELMVGAFSDNQPDYSWIQPYEVKTFKQTWYPIRHIDGVKNANTDAAINMEVSGDSVLIGIYATRNYLNARAVLKSGKNLIIEELINIGPSSPFQKQILLPQGTQTQDLRLSLLTSEGEEVVSYQPVINEKIAIPETVKPPLPPEKLTSVDALYTTGLRLVQFHHPSLDPYPYFEEALKRDPENINVNKILGILYLKGGLFQQAETVLRKAVDTLTRDFTSPLDGEVYYYLGQTLTMQGKFQEAEAAFFKSTWSRAFYSAAYYALAELAVKNEKLQNASSYIDRSLSANSLNTKTLNLKISVLRKLGRLGQAEAICRQVLNLDPLNFRAGYEFCLLLAENNRKQVADRILKNLAGNMRGEVQSYLELAADYLNDGCLDESAGVLNWYISSVPNNKPVFPMVYYYLGYIKELQGKTNEALKYYTEGGRMPADYCFPYRMESIAVLEHAIQTNPSDSKAGYYLGNLLFNHQPARAIDAWEKSADLDDSFAMVFRNLGLAYAWVKNDLPRAVENLEKAIRKDPENPRSYYELDLFYEAVGTGAEKRLAVLKQNHDTVKKRDEALSREIELLVQLGFYDRAIKLLKEHHFHIWEGGGRIYQVWVDAFLLRGFAYLSGKQYGKALADFSNALEYPDNLEVGKPSRGGENSQALYLLGSAYEALGQQAEAKTCYQRALEYESGPSTRRYYQGLANRKLGRQKEAAAIFDNLVTSGQNRLGSISAIDFFAKFGEQQSNKKQQARLHYLIGLGFMGKGQKSRAITEFETAAKLDPNNVWINHSLYN